MRDKEKGQREEQTRHRPKTYIFILVLVAVLGVVVFAAYRDGTGFDFLRRWLAYGEEELGASYDYDAATDNRFALLGKGMAVLSGTDLSLRNHLRGKLLHSLFAAFLGFFAWFLIK